MSFTVYYSKQCKYCDKLLITIEDEKINFLEKYNLICFEDEPNKIPIFITNVPAIISKTINKPLFGIDAIKWIENLKYFNQITNNINNKNVINPNIIEDNDYAFSKESLSYNYTNINDVDNNFNKNLLEFNK